MPLINTPPSCQTVSGIYIEPCNPHPDDILITDIAHCLALANRWAGNTQYLGSGTSVVIDVGGQPLIVEMNDPFPYSVAQHSCLVHDIVIRRFGVRAGFYGLMHDASEAYLMDVPRPIKPLLTNYYAIEAKLMDVILTKFGVPFDNQIKSQVVEIDNAMIFWERDAIVGEPISPYANEDQHPGGTLFHEVPNFCSWSPKRAKAEFLMRFKYHTEFRREVDDEAFAEHLLHMTNDNLGFTAGLAGMAHIDQPRAA